MSFAISWAIILHSGYYNKSIYFMLYAKGVSYTMSYNIYVDRKPSSQDKQHAYWAFVVEGHRFHFHRSFEVPAQDNPRIAYLNYCTEAFRQISHLVSNNILPRADFVFATTHKILAGYIAYFTGDTDNGIKPPKAYFEPAYNAYLSLEAMGCPYSIQVADWATRAKTFATKAYCQAQAQDIKAANSEKAVDVFKNL